jgi:hypothetical protein
MTYRTQLKDAYLTVEVGNLATWIENLTLAGWTPEAIQATYDTRSAEIAERVRTSPELILARKTMTELVAVQRCVAQGVWSPKLPTQSPSTRLFKSTFIRRLSPSEATTLEGVLTSEEAWLRMLYQSVEFFDVADALVGYLHMILTEHLGEDRADVLLAPE